MVWYVMLARTYGHTKGKALDLAVKEFGFRGNDIAQKRRSVQRIVKGPQPSKISPTSFEELVRRTGHALPPKPGDIK